MLEVGETTREIVIHIIFKLSPTCLNGAGLIIAESWKGTSSGRIPTMAGLPTGETGTSAVRLTVAALPSRSYPSSKGRVSVAFTNWMKPSSLVTFCPSTVKSVSPALRPARAAGLPSETILISM